MKHPQRLEDYLDHIVEAIDRATTYLQGVPDIEAFRANLQVQDAVVRNIAVIGEAVNRVQSVDPDFLKRHPHIPWARICEMRNIAIHEYFFVDLEVVWTTVKSDFPQLRQQISELLGR